jgi:hypothetical protein
MVNSKSKGSSFERYLCKALSLWVSGGRNEDLFWRSSLSGGRATVGMKRGKDLSRVSGDICAVAPEGHVLTDRYFIEAKHVKSLDLEAFLFGRGGKLQQFWKKASVQARANKKLPIIIAKQNFYPVVMITEHPHEFIEVGMEPLAVSPLQEAYIFLFDSVLQCQFKIAHRRPIQRRV